ncbi:MAG: ABC transporter ATP-binding protein [Mycobacteriales bacterium]
MTAPALSTPLDAEPKTTWAVFSRGVQLSPGLRRGLPVTILLALLGTVGRVVVPVTVQQTVDKGLRAPGGPDTGRVVTYVLLGALVVLATVGCSFLMNVRLYRNTETALADLRAKAFRHVHDLSMLHQQSERRGALVSRVTSDIDQISNFVQFGGMMVVVSLGQLVLATVLMLIYSWQLTILVYACFLPLFFSLRFFQRRLAAAYGAVRERVGALLGAVAESVVGAPVVRAYGVQARTRARIEEAIDAHYAAQNRAQRIAVFASVTGEFAAGLTNAGVVMVGVWLGVGGHLTLGELTAFLFLVTLFVQPVQVATEVLNDFQNAIAGWRRVLGVLDTAPDVADPGEAGAGLPAGPLGVRFRHVRFAYPAGPEVLHGIDLEIAPERKVAIVGETGSGKTTFVKLLTRLMDPTSGEIEVGGVSLRRVRFDVLRRRVVMVPQDGFLFDATIADNVRYGADGLSDEQVTEAFARLGLADWLAGLPAGAATQVGERGESLSVGERQLVALARAYVADPDLLVLDEATSAVDPATEVRINRALDALTRGRTTIAIAHRLSTAEAADEVIVVDAGRIVQRGPHDALVAEPGVYARLHASWVSQTR